ncbi:hypothetical protein [Arcanobacterium hippocoleae]|uniref:hypothetical protein n=1 Tax=Arcanobacterium hippocoleae TaxID=149017 RepID=UPI00334290CA
MAEETQSELNEVDELVVADELQAETADVQSEAEVVNDEATEISKEPKIEIPEDGVVTEEMVRAKLKGLPGRWYVLHTYAGYEARETRY